MFFQARAQKSRISSCSDETEELIESNCIEIQAPIYEQIPLDDFYIINSALITQENELRLNISYSGGCNEHDFTLVQDPLFCGTPPILITIKLNHNANNDLCNAWLTKDLCFDINTLYASYSSDELSIALSNSHQIDTTWVFE